MNIFDPVLAQQDPALQPEKPTLLSMIQRKKGLDVLCALRETQAP